MSQARRALITATFACVSLAATAQSPAPGNPDAAWASNTAVVVRTDSKARFFPCGIEASGGLLAYYRAVGMSETREAERDAIGRHRTKACRLGTALYLNLADDRMLTLFDAADIEGWTHSFQDYWPEFDAHVVLAGERFTDHLLTYVVAARDGRLFTFEGGPIRSPSGTGALFWGGGLTGFAGVVFLDGAELKSYEPSRVSQECPYGALGSAPRWIDDTTIEFEPGQFVAAPRRVLLRRSAGGKWTWEC